MNIDDMVLLAISAMSSIIMVLGGLISRRRREQGVVFDSPPHDYCLHIINARVSGLTRYAPTIYQTFEVKIAFSDLKVFGGIWKCAKLGCGGWGCSYKCEKEGRVVVFKVPRGFEDIIEKRERITVSKELLNKVVEEGEVVSRLGHPHILRLLGFSRYTPLLIYEYADYGSLQWQMDNGWKPSVRDVVLIGLQIGDALRYIHSRGLVHGDVKPGNIFFVDGMAKLGDFSSLVKLISMTNVHGGFAFTPGWSAPEQLHSGLREKAAERGLENRIDVYQFGNLILYLLAGETVDGENVFKKGYVQRALDRVANTELRSLLTEIIRANPEERPSMDEVMKKLCKISF